jgi:outer membrane protein
MKKALLIVFSFACLKGIAQTGLSLSEAINTALKNSYDIQLARNNLEISNVNNNIGVAGGLPQVLGTANDNQQITTINQQFSDASRDTKRSNVGSNNLNMGVTGTIVLSNGYRVIATKKRLEELEKQNQQLLNAQIQNTIAAVMARYYDVLRQMNLMKTVQQSIEVSKQRLQIVQVRKEVGLANNADLYQAQLDLSNQVQTAANQELVINQSMTDLQRQIFIQPDTAMFITDTTIVIDSTISFEQVRSALKNNPELLAASQQVNISELVEKEVAAQRYPTLRASTGYNFASAKSAAGFSQLNQSYGPFLGINLSVPIYNGSAFKRQQRVAEINTKNATLLRNNLVMDFESGAVRSYQAYTNSLDQLRNSKENFEVAKQLVDVVFQRLQLGEGTLVDMKLALQSFELEGYRRANLFYTAKIAEVELKRLSNQLTP